MNPLYQNLLQQQLIVKYPDVKTLVEQLYLKAITSAYPRIKVISEINSLTENAIRNEVIRDFKFHNPLISNFIQNKIIFITAENQAYTSSLLQRTDIEFLNSIHQHKFVIECKRLSSAENRYLQGRITKGEYQHDGLEKFLDLTYAVEDDEGAMLTFLIGGDPAGIVSSLNKKVQIFEPAQNSVDLTGQRCVNWQLSFQSKHMRTDGREFHIYHLFYDLT